MPNFGDILAISLASVYNLILIIIFTKFYNNFWSYKEIVSQNALGKLSEYLKLLDAISFAGMIWYFNKNAFFNTSLENSAVIWLFMFGYALYKRFSAKELSFKIILIDGLFNSLVCVSNILILNNHFWKTI